MLMDLPPKKPHRSRPTIRPAYPSVPGPVLVSVFYDTGTAVHLTFDRAIDIAGIVPGEIVVDDGQFDSTRYVGFGAGTLLTATTVMISLMEAGGASGGQVLLSAGAGNGIVATDDDAPWAGVTGWVVGG